MEANLGAGSLLFSDPLTRRLPGVRQVVQASVVAHVVMAALQRRGRGASEGVRALGAAADVGGVGDGV